MRFIPTSSKCWRCTLGLCWNSLRKSRKSIPPPSVSLLVPLMHHDQVDSKSPTCRSCVGNHLYCPSPRYPGYVCARNLHRTCVNPFAELQAARDVLIQRLGKEFARAAAGNKDRYVSSRVRSYNCTPRTPINSRPGRSSSSGSSPVGRDARRLPHQGRQGLWYRMDPWATVAREVRPFDFLHVKLLVSF